MNKDSVLNKANAWLLVAFTSVLISGVSLWEGEKYLPYNDIVGVLTVCRGYTGPDIVRTKTYTKDECADVDNRALLKHATGVLGCTKATLTQPVFDAMTMFAYNVGVDAYCHSTPRKQLDVGNVRGACDALLAWSKARVKGELVTVQGLLNRRTFERKICLRGVV